MPERLRPRDAIGTAELTGRHDIGILPVAHPLNEIFDFELSQKPRNGAFIDALANYIVMRGAGGEITDPACQQQAT